MMAVDPFAALLLGTVLVGALLIVLTALCDAAGR